MSAALHHLASDPGAWLNGLAILAGVLLALHLAGRRP